LMACLQGALDLCELGKALQHLIGCLHGLGVDFVGALGLDHVDHFLNHVDIRGFYKALIERPDAVGAWRVSRRRARRGGLDKQILAACFQAGGGEADRELQRTDLRRCRLPPLADADDTVASTSARLPIRGNWYRW